MTHQETPSGRPLDREKTLFRYTCALDRGDFETVAAALTEAEGDPVLAQMILEVNEVMAAEIGAQSLSVVGAVRSWVSRVPKVAWAVGAVIAALLICGGMLANFQYERNLGAYYAFQDPNPFAIPLFLQPASGDEMTGEPPQAAADAQATISALQVQNGAPAQGVGAIQVTPLDRMLAPTPTPAVRAEGTPGVSLPMPTGTSRPPAEPQEPMIVKNGEIEIVVEDTGVAIERISQIAADGGGYVLSSQAWSSGEDHSAAMVIAVQVDQFETAMRRIRDLAMDVVFESSSGQDVSTEYVDLQSRLRNLEATRDRILTFLERAETVEEALAINAELSEIEAQIEQVQGRMQYLAGRAAYSTITISIEEFINATPTPTPTLTPTPTPWSLGPRIEKATEQQTVLVRGLL